MVLKNILDMVHESDVCVRENFNHWNIRPVMRVLVQRVKEARVEVEQKVVGEIGPGLLLLVGLGKKDNQKTLAEMAKKAANLRIFSDEQGRFQHSVLETEGAVLAVPQFTLFAETSKGRRPEFFSALAPAQARPLSQKFLDYLRAEGIKQVESGEFGADMQVSLVNDGPVTLMLEL